MAYKVNAPSGKKLISFLVIAAIVLLVAFSDRIAMFVSNQKLQKSSVPLAVELSDTEVGANRTENVKVVLPSGRPMVRNALKEIRFLVMQWNTQLGLFLANGGPMTLTESLIGKRGGLVKIINQDDTTQMQIELLKFAKSWADAGGKGNPDAGAQAIIVMGDGAPAYLSQLNVQARKFCKDNKLPEADCEIVDKGAVGSSYGEDQHFIPEDWANNPQTALGRNSKHGGLIAAYFWDGDHILGIEWCQMNGLPVNGSDKTWDPDACNFVNAADYKDAVVKYNAGYCEQRDEIVNGKLTGKKVNPCTEAVDTWSPADLNISKGPRFTLVSGLSTRRNLNQMAATILAPRGWARQNDETLGKILASTYEAGDMIKSSDVALNRAAEAAVAVYKGAGQNVMLSASEWVSLYKGETHKNKNGVEVAFGGSRVWNLADAIQYFGMDGGPNIYEGVYTQIGNMVHALAPSIIEKLQPASEIMDLSAIAKAHEILGENTGKADVVKYDAGAVQEVVGNANYSINFEVGSDKVLPDSFPIIEKIYQQLNISSFKADIVGHTDNTGSAQLNRDLSRRRAESVKAKIMEMGKGGIASIRVNATGEGSDRPLNPNANQDSPAERARNRRVEVTLGQ